MWRSKTLAFAAILAAVAVAGCGTAVTSPATLSSTASATEEVFESTQRNEGGEVTVEVTWNGPVAGAVFDVTLDTHFVDLDALDLSDALLTNDRGDRLAAMPWEAPKGGHHRQGRLSFEGETARFLAEARWIELRMVDIGAVPARALRWEVAE